MGVLEIAQNNAEQAAKSKYGKLSRRKRKELDEKRKHAEALAHDLEKMTSKLQANADKQSRREADDAFSAAPTARHDIEARFSAHESSSARKKAALRQKWGVETDEEAAELEKEMAKSKF